MPVRIAPGDDIKYLDEPQPQQFGQKVDPSQIAYLDEPQPVQQERQRLPIEDVPVIGGLASMAADAVYNVVNPEGAFAKSGIDASKNPIVSDVAGGVYGGMQSAYSLANRANGDAAISDVMNRNLDAYNAQAAQAHPGVLNEAVRGTVSSLTGTVPAAYFAGPAGAIARATASQMSQSATTGADAGLSGSDLTNYVLREGAIEAVPALVMQVAGMGGLESSLAKLFGKTAADTGRGVLSALKSAGISTVQELPEEIVTEIGHNVNTAVSGVDPSQTSPENLMNTALQVGLQTALSFGLVESPNIARGAVQSVTAPAPSAPSPQQPQDSRSKLESLGLSVSEGQDEVTGDRTLTVSNGNGNQFVITRAEDTGHLTNPTAWLDSVRREHADSDVATMADSALKSGDPEQIRAAVGAAREAGIRTSGSYRVNINGRDATGIVSLADPEEGGDTLDHELFHHVIQTTLAPNEYGTLVERFKKDDGSLDEELAVDAYLKTVKRRALLKEGREQYGSALQKIFWKAQDGFRRLKSYLFGKSAYDIFADTGDGRMMQRGMQSVDEINRRRPVTPEPTPTPAPVAAQEVQDVQQPAIVPDRPVVVPVENVPVENPPAELGRIVTEQPAPEGMQGDAVQPAEQGGVTALDRIASDIEETKRRYAYERRPDRIDVGDESLQAFRDMVRRDGGVKVPVRQDGRNYTEDFGGRFPVGVLRRDASLSWDQWGQTAVEMGLLQPDHTMEDFRNLFVGESKKTIAVPYESARGGDASGKPEPTKFDALNSVANKYGWNIDGGSLYNGSGKKVHDVVIKKGRVRLESGGVLRGSFPVSKPDSLGNYLEKTFYAKTKDSEASSSWQDSPGDELFSTATDGGSQRFSTAQAEDRAYMDAVNRGDMDAAQQMVDDAAKRAGYGLSDYQINHTAPNREDVPITRMTDIWPDDIYDYTSARYYGHGDDLSMDEAAASAIRKTKGKDENSRIFIFRAVPKINKESMPRNGDWVTLTRQYAREHGKAHLSEGYRIQVARVPLKNVYTDGNSIHEFGYDDGSEYVYKNTLNNRKLADPVTRDDAGSVIPLSKRFNSRSNDIRFSTAAERTAAGEDSTGRPELANPGQSEDARRAVRNVQTEMGTPETRKWDEVRRIADTLDAKEVEKTMESGRGLTDSETFKAVDIMQDAAEVAIKTNDWTRMTRLVRAYIRTGTETGRALSARRDRVQSPSERLAQAVGLGLAVPKKATQERLNKIDDAIREIEGIKGELENSRQEVERLKEQLKEEQKKSREELEKLKQDIARLESQETIQDEAIGGRKPLSESQRAELNELRRLRAKWMEKYNAKMQELRDQLAEKNKRVAELTKQLEASQKRQGELKKLISERDMLLKRNELEILRLQDELARKNLEISELMKRLKDIPPGERSLANPVIQDAVTVVREIQARKATFSDAMYEFWISSLLSGPQTHAVNIFSNMVNGLWDMTFQRWTEAAVNSVYGKARGTQFGELKYLYSGMVPGFRRAVQNMMLSWRTENAAFHEQIREMQKLHGQKLLEFEDRTDTGYSTEHNTVAISGTKGRVIRAPLRALTAMDEFCKSLFGQMEAGAQAYRIAKEQGLAGDDLSRSIAEQVDDLGSVAWGKALEESMRITFQERMPDWAETASTAIGRTPFRYVIPFRRTPVNIFRTGFRKSPLGMLSTAIQWNKLNDDAKVRRLSEGLISVALTAGLYAIIGGDDDDGVPWFQITGSMPFKATKPGIRDLGYRTGRPGQSICFGDKSYSYARVEPFATTLSATVDMLTAFKNSDKPDAAKRLFERMGSMVVDKTFMRGLGDMIAAAQDSDNFESWVTNFATSMVPFGSAIRQVNRAADSYQRDSNSAGGKGLLQKATGYGAALPAKVDLWGQSVKKDTGATAATDFLFRLLSPVATQDASDRLPAAKRMDMLLMNWNNAHPEDERAPQMPRRYIERDGRRYEMNNEQYARFCKEAGKRALQTLSGRSLNAMKPTKKDVDEIESAIEIGRTAAANEFLARMRR